MNIEVHYWNQLRDASGVDKEQFTLESPATLHDLLRLVAKREKLNALIFAEDESIAAGILIDQNGETVRDPSVAICDGDRIHLATPISGG